MNTEHYKEMLLSEKAVLEEELSAIGNKTDREGDYNITADNSASIDSREDVAEKFEDLQERKATEAPLEARLAEVLGALERIENGTYGKCEISGEDIETDRLEANPAARTCKAHIDQANGLH